MVLGRAPFTIARSFVGHHKDAVPTIARWIAFHAFAPVDVKIAQIVLRVRSKSSLEETGRAVPILFTVDLHAFVKVAEHIRQVREGRIVVTIETLENADWLCLAFDNHLTDFA